MSIADKLLAVSENVPKVYEAGKNAEYDRFWNILQQNGKRTDYRNGLGGKVWNDDNFRPKYDITIDDGYMAFAHTSIADMAQTLENAGVTMSKYTISNTQYMFMGASNLTRVPIIRLKAGTHYASTAYGMFDGCQSLKTVDKIVLENDTQSSTFWTSAFNNCRALENIVFEGVIGSNISFSASPLSKDSIKSIINALSESTSGLTVTLNKSAVNSAFTESEWALLVATKPNWNVSLS